MRQIIEKVEDYNELETIEKLEGREALVLYSNLLYRVISGEWIVIGKVVWRGGWFAKNAERT
ncbi:MAG: hypothetical protein HY611_03570 [Elusimicrobia bacterium]|nr:hypothetical protein [Elusimicrobiota bacterium]